MSVLPSQEEKAAYIEQMFARIAPGYDRMNALMTFGLDRGWREYAVRAVAPPATGRALDIGSGTGDFLRLLTDWMPHGMAVGVDFTLPMMQAGHSRIDRTHAAFVGGDALRLPFANASFDAITTGFTMRNVVDIGQAFGEMYRIARPGCLLACLEVARPRNPLLRLGHRLYFEQVVPQLARILGADPTAYTYLPQSARRFPAPDTLAGIIHDAGWSEVRYQLLGAGAVAVHMAVKRA